MSQNDGGTIGIGRHAHFDCFSGAAGDMMLASCIDAAPDKEAMLQQIRQGLQSIGEIRHEFDISIAPVLKGPGSIAAKKVTVHSIYNHKAAPVPGPKAAETRMETKEIDGHSHQHEHEHSHGHEHSHDSGHEHSHAHEHTHNSGHEQEDAHEHKHEHSHENAHSPETKEKEAIETEVPSHSHEHSHGHGHQHDHSHSSSGGGPLRNLPQIRILIESSALPKWVKRNAIAVFTELAKAEAMTHGCETADQVHFHEVGAIDSIVDTVGTVYALHLLNVKSISCSHLPMGEGSVMTDHGLLPVPAPATLRLLQDMPVCPGPPGVTGELVTPTAAALLKVLTKTSSDMIGPKHRVPIGRSPHMTIRTIGLGAGTKEFPKHANIVRVVIGDLLHHQSSSSNSVPIAPLTASESTMASARSDATITMTMSKPNHTSEQALPRAMDQGEAKMKDVSVTDDEAASSSPSWLSSSLWKVDQLTHLEANIDDATSEVLAYTVEKLLAVGAIDAWTAPIVMKKGRAAHTLHCLCHSETSEAVDSLLKVMFRQTTTLGIRVHHRDVDRVALNRRFLRSVQTPFVNDATDGRVDVKVGLLGKEVTSIAAEYDHCRAIADATGVPLKFVSELAIAEARKFLQEEKDNIHP